LKKKKAGSNQLSAGYEIATSLALLAMTRGKFSLAYLKKLIRFVKTKNECHA
jgi:hypothetical protein